MTQNESLQSRIDDLESRVAFQEQAIEELSDLVYGQQQELTRLRQALESLHRRTKEIVQRLPDGSEGHEPPPHY